MSSVSPVLLPPRYAPALDVVGQGGFGTVYRTQDVELGIPVAIKVPHQSGFGRDAARELAAELQASASLSHPGIVQVLDAGQDPQGRPWLAMEYVDGGSVERWINAEPPPWDGVLPALLELLDALGHAHARSLVHRDIKPANVLLARDDDGVLHPRLADFGLAKIREGRGDYRSTRLLAGTLLYMSPETFEGNVASIHPAVDLYAFGVLLYEIVSERPPWVGAGLSLVMQKSQRSHRPLVPRDGYEVPDRLPALVDWLLTTEPSQRPALAADVRAELEQVGTSAFPALLPPRAAQRSFPATPAVALQREPVLLGREGERQALWDAALRAGGGPVALALVGEAGVGRSALCSWLAERLEELGLARTLHLRIESPDDLLPALDRGIRAFLGLGRLTGHELELRVMARACGLGLPADDARALLGWLAAGAESGARGPSGEIRVALVGALLRAAAVRGRAVFWLEDGCDDSRVGAELVEGLLRLARLEGLPLLVLHEVGDAEVPPGLQPLPIGPLDDRAIRAIVHGLVPDHPLLPREVRQARGNPRRAVEGARLLATRILAGAAPGRPVQVPSAGAVSAVTAPTQRPSSSGLETTRSIGDIGRARLDAWLAGDEADSRARLLVLLSLMPRPCARSDLEVAWSRVAGATLQPVLDGALAAGLLLRTERAEWGFHGAVLEGAAAAFVDAFEETATLAEACAAALEEGSEADPLRGLAAARLHFRAGATGPAYELAFEAGRWLEGRDVGAARAAFDLAGSALEQVGIGLPDPLAVELLLSRAHLARLAGELAEAAAALEALEPGGLEPKQEARWRELRASVHLPVGEPEQALEQASRAVELYEALDRPGGRSRARLLAADAEARCGRRESSLAGFEKALAVAEEAGLLREQLGALVWMARVQLRAGRGDPRVRAEARGSFERALELARRLRAGNLEGTILRDLGLLAVNDGQPERAAELLQRSIEQLRRCGLDGEAATTRIALGELARSRGDLAAARKQYSVALGVTRAFGITQDTLVALIDLAMTELGMGRLSSAARRLRDIDALLPPERPHAFRAWVAAVRLGVAAGEGRWEDAEHAFERLADVGHDLVGDHDLVQMTERAADAAREADEPALASEVWDLARRMAAAAGDVEGVGRLEGKLRSLV